MIILIIILLILLLIIWNHYADPAPAAEENDVELLGQLLLNPTKSLWERYRAMFALRNINTDKSIATLAKGKIVYNSVMKAFLPIVNYFCIIKKMIICVKKSIKFNLISKFVTNFFLPKFIHFSSIVD